MSLRALLPIPASRGTTASPSTQKPPHAFLIKRSLPTVVLASKARHLLHTFKTCMNISLAQTTAPLGSYGEKISARQSLAFQSEATLKKKKSLELKIFNDHSLYLPHRLINIFPRHSFSGGSGGYISSKYELIKREETYDTRNRSPNMGKKKKTKPD